jgi:hypothetical protein
MRISVGAEFSGIWVLKDSSLAKRQKPTSHPKIINDKPSSKEYRLGLKQICQGS